MIDQCIGKDGLCSNPATKDGMCADCRYYLLTHPPQPAPRLCSVWGVNEARISSYMCGECMTKARKPTVMYEIDE